LTLIKPHDETVVSWLENAIEVAHLQSDKVLFYLGCVRNRLTEMRHRDDCFSSVIEENQDDKLEVCDPGVGSFLGIANSLQLLLDDRLL